MFCAVYKFALTDAPRAEQRFVAAWTGITAFYQRNGALRSILHKELDGHFVSTAYWPDKASYDGAHNIPRDDAFTRHAVEWSEVCVPSDILFEGEVITTLDPPR